MIRWLTTMINSVRAIRSKKGSVSARTDAPSDAPMLQDAEYMSAESREFVHSSLAAWNSLDESERRVPTRL